MTLVACSLNKRNIPFMVGDILWSSKFGKENLVLPTNIYPINQFIPNEQSLKPDSFNQKIYLINSRVCVCFSGDEIEILKFLKEIKLRCRIYGDEIDAIHLKEFLDEYKLEEQFIKSSLIIFWMNKQGKGGMFNFPKNIHEFGENKNMSGWFHLRSDVFGEVYASGSGRNTYLDLLNQKIDFKSSHEAGDIWNAIQTNVGQIARLLALEKITALTFQQNWGGGFETIFYNGREFQKFDEITYIISHGQFDETGDIGLPNPRLILYYKYYGERLLITAIEILYASKEKVDKKITFNSNPGEFVVNFFVVSGIDEENISVDQLNPNFSFECHTMAMGYGIISKTNSTYNPGYFVEHPELGVTYIHNKSVQLVLSEEISNDVSTGSRGAFPNIK